MRIFTLLVCFTLLSQIVFAQTPYYIVKFPDDKTYIGCNANVPVEMPIVTQYSCNINVGISRHDEVYYSNETGSCFKILRRWHVNYWCDYNPNLPPTYVDNPVNSDIGPTAAGTPSNNGFLEYIQIIKVHDQDPPVFTNCPTNTVVFCDYTNNNTALYGNACEGPVDLQTEVSDVCSGTDINLSYRLYLDLDGNGSMETYIHSSSPNAWPIEKTVDSGKVRGKIVFPAGHQLPYGLHKIEWIANDNCGNESICKYTFQVKDCKNPTVVCLNGLSVNIMQTGMITMQTASFIQYVSDNCTPANQIKTAIRKAGTGLGFPVNSTSLNFDCTEVGTQAVEVWAEDAYGNADFCITYVIVQDHNGTCAPTASLTGVVMKPGGQPVGDVQITALKPNQSVAAAVTTNANGVFGPVALYPMCYSLNASSNLTETQGVTTWDALLAALQSEGITSLDQPWQYVAADVNGDGWITQEDSWAIMQMAIGASATWPGVPHTQFVAANSTIPVDEIDLTGGQQVCPPGNVPTAFNWTAVKTGDLDIASGSNKSISKRAMVFSAADQTFEAGETVVLTIAAPDADGVAGYQFTLEYDPFALSVNYINPGQLENVQTVRFDSEHQITLGWQNTLVCYSDGASLFKNKELIHVVFTAHQAGKLSDMVFMTSNRIPAEAYTRDMQQHNAALVFATTADAARLMGVTPDPSAGGEVMVRYFLPEETTARVIVSDSHGRIMKTQVVNGQAGYHEIYVPVEARVSGSYLMQLVTDKQLDTRRITVKR